MTTRLSRIWHTMLLVALAASASAAEGWETDFRKASDAAKAANRYMLLDFSGSDWCGWCMRLDKEVFSQKGFQEYAGSNLVCVLLDFPRGKEIPKELKEQNEKLAGEYEIGGFPTVIVLSPAGETVAKTGYQQGGADNYVKHLKGIIDPHRTKNKIPAPAPVSEEKTRTGAGKASKLPVRVTLPADENREPRMWKSAGGDTLMASLVEEQGPYVVLKKEDGKKVRIAFQSLSEEDRKYIAGLKDALTAKDAPVGKK